MRIQGKHSLRENLCCAREEKEKNFGAAAQSESNRQSGLAPLIVLAAGPRFI
jgi:hypothetical protein